MKSKCNTVGSNMRFTTQLVTILTNVTLPSSWYAGSPSIFQPSGGVTYPGGSAGGKLYIFEGGVYGGGDSSGMTYKTGAGTGPVTFSTMG